MATRIQMRRGTTSEWNAADPTLNEGEIGYNSTLGQIKVGDGETIWSELDYLVSDGTLDTSLGSYIPDTEKSAIDGVAELDGSKNILAPAGIIFEGTANDHETTFVVEDPTADRTITFPDATGQVVFRDTTDTLTNKTLTNPSVSGLYISDLSITVEGTANEHETTLTFTDPTQDRTITVPNASGTLVLADGSGNITVSGNLTVQGTTTTIDSTTIAIQNAFVFEGSTANDFETTLQVTDPTADRTLTLPDATGTILSTADFSAKGALLVGTSSGAFSAKSVGTNGKVLTADSTQADGIIWADAAGGGADLNMIIMGAFI